MSLSFQQPDGEIDIPENAPASPDDLAPLSEQELVERISGFTGGPFQTAADATREIGDAEPTIQLAKKELEIRRRIIKEI